MSSTAPDKLAIGAPRPGAAKRFHSLDGLRGIAACIVMLYHYAAHEHWRFLMHGYLAVDLFFILSGFVICHSYTGKMLSGMTAGQFINRRMARLIPTVAGGVILGAIATWLTYKLSGQEYDAVKFVLVHIGHIFLLPAPMDFEVPAREIVLLFPTNPPLWSIFFELVASIGFVWFVRWRNSALLAGWIVFFALFVLGSVYAANIAGTGLTANVGWNQSTFFSGFPRAISAFLCGMLVYRLTRKSPTAITDKIGNRTSAFLILILYAGAAGLLMFPFYAKGLYQFAAIFVLFPLLIGVANFIPVRMAWLVSVSAWLGELSFPLYAVHIPVENLIKWFLSLNGIEGLSTPVLLGLKVACALLAAYILHRLLALTQASPRLGRALKPVTG